VCVGAGTRTVKSSEKRGTESLGLGGGGGRGSWGASTPRRIGELPAEDF
jgi:hypothetical protein